MIFRIALSFLLVSLTLLSGCGHTRSVRLQARDDYAQGKYNEAETKLLSTDVVSESKSRLLTLMELGSVANAKGEYEKSTLYFLKAQELANKLYTTSVSEQFLTGIGNDNAASYRGFDYEISMVHYYLVMNNLMIAQAGKIDSWEMMPLKEDDKVIMDGIKASTRELSAKEISEYKNRARAEALAWDTFLDTVRQKNRGLALYKDDIAAKILASFVHRMAGTHEDLSTAKILYQNAKDVLTKSYGLFPTFNQKASAFASNYRHLASMSPDEIRRNYLTPTAHFENLENFLSLSQKESSTDGADTDRSDVVNSGKNSTLVVLETGIIPEKREKAYNIGIGAAFNAIEDPGLRNSATIIGLAALIHFAPQVIFAGLIEEAIDQESDRREGQTMAREDRDTARTINRATDKAIGFRFKLPTIPSVPTDVAYQVTFTSSDGRALQVPLVAVNPINDFASQEVDSKAAAIATKTGIRVGVKYLGALVTAYLAYQATYRETRMGWLALSAGTVAWMAAKKIVDATEAADVRAWNMLPQTLSMMEAKLAPGDYKVSATATRGMQTWNFGLGTFKVNATGKNIFKGRIQLDPRGVPSQSGQRLATLD